MKNSFKLLLAFILVIFIFSSCDKKQKEATKASEISQNNDGLKLMETNCYACHNPKAASHDAIIAPPLMAIKNRYGMKYTTKESFVDAIVKWSLDPKQEEALMYGAVKQYNVMPKQPFAAADLKKIATYIYDNEIEVPSWFAEHEKQMHGGK